MTIVFRHLDFPDKICRFELNNSKCVDTARLIYAEEITVVYGIVLWEHPKYYRRGIIYKRAEYGHIVIPFLVYIFPLENFQFLLNFFQFYNFFRFYKL